MPLNGPLLADLIKNGLGFATQPQSAQNLGMANDIVTHVQTGIVNFAPGTITGTAPPSGGPLILGAGIGGLITLVPSALQALFISNFSTVTPEILNMATAISVHISTLGLVTFAPGTINGACTNTPVSPGVFTGVGLAGTIAGLIPSTLAFDIALAINQSAPTTELINMATEICNHVMTLGLVSLPVVTGVCAPGGGPITLGTAPGGVIV